MNAGTSRTKRAKRAALAASLLIGSVVVGSLDGSAVHAAVVYDGSSPAQAAASCWEVKQVAPDSTSGAYWLLTPSLQGPQQFYCDQETDGGGWVLIGKGREGWQEYYNGQGSAAALLNPPTPRTPSYFSPVQLPASTVDDLLDHGDVTDLTDGIRLLRARNSTGTEWQEVRMRLSRRDRFVWTFGAAHPIQNYGFDGSNSNGGTTGNFGNDSAWRRVTFSEREDQNWTMGFAYGGSSTGGSTAADNFLYSALSTGGSSRPYTEVYLRPRLTQADLNWTAIPDTGTAEFEQRAIASSYAARGDWGVTGYLNGSNAERNQEVQDFIQIGNRMFVAGNFRYVQRGSNTQTRVNQAGLAAFDVNTGAYISTFTPQFDNQVKGVAELPNGKLIAVGDFSTVNGTAATGTVVLDPITGAIDPGWRVDIENRLSSGVRTVTTVDVSGNYVYIAGNFTHLGTTPTSSKVYARAAARLQWATGTPDGSWNPAFNWTVVDNDMSADGTRMYAAGFFTQSLQGETLPALNAAAVRTVPGAPLEPWSPVWSNSKSYQQAIREVGNRVFVGGSEHSLFAWDTTSFERTSGSTTHGRGGDFQAIGTGHGVVYGGQHAADWNYESNYTWRTIGNTWTQADKTRWIGAYDAVTGEFLPSFNPPFLGSGIGGARRGVWAIHVDDAGTVWAGGDLSSARYNSTSTQWAGGFVRFPLVDHTAPSTPSGVQVTTPTATTASLTWNASSDDRGSLQYEVLRNDRVVATTSTRNATIDVENGDRLFVRAVDAAGNRSASSPVYDLSAPPTTTTTTTTTSTTSTTTTTTTAPPQGEVTTTPIAFQSTWRYRYELAAPPSNWATSALDDTTWNTGAAPIGWGHTSIATDLNRPTAERALALYHRNTINVANAAAVTALQLSVIVDDGAVVYVNGTEVNRTRMPAGTITHNSWSSASITTATARANPTIINVPVNLLVNGTNIIAVETHLGYRSAPNISFDLQATLTTGSGGGTTTTTALPTTTTTTTTTTAPPQGEVTTTPIAFQSTWRYRYELAAPPSNWATSALDDTTWNTGAAPIGWGHTSIATDLNRPTAERALALYHRNTINVANAAAVTALQLSVIVDDGAVVYVNGTEVNRTRMPAGTITHNSWSSASITTATARANPTIINVPVNLLVNGTNIIAVETHLGYRSAPNISFDLQATLTS